MTVTHDNDMNKLVLSQCYIVRSLNFERRSVILRFSPCLICDIKSKVSFSVRPCNPVKDRKRDWQLMEGMNDAHFLVYSKEYREVQLDFTPEIEVVYAV